MELPCRVVVGSGAVSEISEICDDLKLKSRPLIITGPNTLDVVGKEISQLWKGSSQRSWSLRLQGWRR